MIVDKVGKLISEKCAIDENIVVFEHDFSEFFQSHWTFGHICKQLRVLEIDLEPAERFLWTKVGLVEPVELREVVLFADVWKLLAFDDISRNQTRDDMKHGYRIIDL